jgi:hypothetical protein
MRYYKVHRGFGDTDFIPIDETELKKAIYAHITGKVAVLSGGTINGTAINAIMPDYHRGMGWNYGHKMEVDDWADVNKKLPNHHAYIAAAKEEVTQALKSGDESVVQQALNEPVQYREGQKRIGGTASIGELLPGKPYKD